MTLDIGSEYVGAKQHSCNFGWNSDSLFIYIEWIKLLSSTKTLSDWIILIVVSLF